MSNTEGRTDGRRARGVDKRESILDAAANLIGRVGYAAASTRAVAGAADVPLSLVHYHFGSRAGLLTAVLERENDRLLERQRELFSGDGTLADRWRAAAAYFEEDLASGYVRMLWELWAAGLCDPELAERWRVSVDGWVALIEETIDTWAREHGRPLPLPAHSLANMVAIVYHGLETHILADQGQDLRGHRELLAAIGDCIERFEKA
ncbi:TetR/AcrR family transcriptional regulator [Gaiella sp.]|uniref:TetR/AcrR family transcriptional regulator n=1 Tax=Gaiella sp. TaxID=2663207 RepID=UPI00326651B8